MLKHPIPLSEFLSTLPLFSDIDPATIGRLCSGITSLDLPKGAIFVRRGDPCSGMHLVVYGHVKLSLQAPRGDEKVVRLIGRGGTLGEAAMFLEQPYQTAAECLADTKLLHLSKNTIYAEIDCNPAFARLMIRRLSERLSNLVTDLEGCTLRSGTQRVISYLLGELSSDAQPDRSAITLCAQKSVIASHLNLTHEHFSRILHDLIAGGLIDVRGPVVRILDAAQLRIRAT